MGRKGKATFRMNSRHLHVENKSKHLTLQNSLHVQTVLKAGYREGEVSLTYSSILYNARDTEEGFSYH